jgi:hypothetical protein
LGAPTKLHRTTEHDGGGLSHTSRNVATRFRACIGGTDAIRKPEKSNNLVIICIENKDDRQNEIGKKKQKLWWPEQQK